MRDLMKKIRNIAVQPGSTGALFELAAEVTQIVRTHATPEQWRRITSTLAMVIDERIERDGFLEAISYAMDTLRAEFSDDDWQAMRRDFKPVFDVVERRLC